MKGLKLVVTLFLFLYSAAVWSAPNIDSIKAGVVKITAGSELGTGIVVRKDGDEVYIVTAAHVVYACPVNNITVTFFGEGAERSYKIKVIDVEPEPENKWTGLAMLRVSGNLNKFITALPLATEIGLDVGTVRGTAVTIIGHQEEDPWSVHSGVVADVDDSLLHIKAEIDVGTSGGPVMLNGYVIGLVQSSNPSDKTCSASVDKKIKEYIENQIRREFVHGVMIFGGSTASGQWDNTVDNWDPEKKRWRKLPPVPDTNLCQAGAFMLRDGRVLVAGGGSPDGCVDNSTTTQKVRWYLPIANLWVSPACPDKPCMKLSNGMTFELDKETKSWRVSDCKPESECMMYGRNSFASMLLKDGRAFVYGGCTGGCNGPNAIEQTVIMTNSDELARVAEIFDPNTKTWSVTPPSLRRRTNASSVDMNGGLILVCGGNDGFTTTYDDCEIYDLNSGFNRHRPWSWAGRMPIAGTPRLASLQNAVLGISGSKWWIWSMTGDYWYGNEKDPVGSCKAGGTLPKPVEGGTLTTLSDGRVLLTGGTISGKPSNAVQIFKYDPETKKGAWEILAPMKHARNGHVALELIKGGIFVAGGCGKEPLKSAEVFDLNKGSWSEKGGMSVGRCSPMAVEIPER